MDHEYDVLGTTFTGYLVDGSRGRTVPGVLVGHEGPGLTEHPKERACRLAERGYVAFAFDLYGEPPPPIERAMEHVKALREDRTLLRRRTRAAYDALRSHPQVDPRHIGAVGFCFGGMAVLELARDGAELDCVVGLHPGLDAEPPGDADRIRGRVLLCCGARDPLVTPAHRLAFEEEMEAAGVDWQVLLLGGARHSFTNPGIDAHGFPGFSYDQRSDERAWSAMCSLFDEAWGRPDSAG